MGKSPRYNQQLASWRTQRGLSLRQAAKEIGIPRFLLSLYEGGYFRPKGKIKEKIEAYYGQSLNATLEGEYPGPIPVPAKPEKPRKKRLLISGILSAFFLLCGVAGASLFGVSSANAVPLYGEAYGLSRDSAVTLGQRGRDIVTDLPYSYLTNGKEPAGRASIAFYDTNSILYFNECTFTSNTILASRPDLGLGRFHFRFGGDLGRDSFRCTFTYNSFGANTAFSADFRYIGKDVTSLLNLSTIVEGTVKADEALALTLINVKVHEAASIFTVVLTEAVGKRVDFISDFLPARESGRRAAFAMEVTGLSLLFPSIAGFFLGGAVFLLTFLRRRKFMLTHFDEERVEEGRRPVPWDWNVPFAVPDFLIVFLSKVLGYVSVFLLLLSSIGRFLFPLPAFLLDENFLSVCRICFFVSPFLDNFVMFGSIKKEGPLFTGLFKYLLCYLCLATFETALIGVTNAWGYDVAELLYHYVPCNVFLAATLQYLVFFFLFFEPAFIRERGGRFTVAWHLLSLLPVAAIVATMVVGNSYQMIYGVKKNIYVLFWFSDYHVCLSLCSIFFLYAMFFVRSFYRHRYGSRDAAIFHFGNRYMLVSNAACALIVVAIALIDLAFRGSEWGYYLGLGDNTWLLLLVPFIVFCRFGPSYIETRHANEESITGILL